MVKQSALTQKRGTIIFRVDFAGMKHQGDYENVTRITEVVKKAGFERVADGLFEFNILSIEKTKMASTLKRLISASLEADSEVDTSAFNKFMATS